MRDYYELLQVHPRADQQAIEAAYERLRAQYDPARLDGAADELVAMARARRDELDRAYAVLSDPARRAAYDEERAAQADPLAGDAATAAEDDPLLDYRPLPPAGGQERPAGFNSEPTRPAPRPAGRRVGPVQARRWLAPAAAALALALLLGIGFALTGGGGPPRAQPTPTPALTDQFEPLIAQAKQTAEQNPTSAQAWIDYGNILYDSVQVVREQQPNSPLYTARLPRWLEATQAYTRALQLQPDNATVRGDLATSACLYGAGTGDITYVRQGLREARRAASQAPQDPRVLLSLGNCLISEQPPRTDEALETWRKIVEVAPNTPFASQAQVYITQYGGR